MQYDMIRKLSHSVPGCTNTKEGKLSQIRSPVIYVLTANPEPQKDSNHNSNPEPPEL
jgi:hypothetical protein